MWLLTGDGDGGDVKSIGILETTDGGVTWKNTSLSYTITQNIRMYKLLMHPTDPNIQFAVGNTGILRTTNGWDSFTTERTGNFYDIEFKPTNPGTMYACGGTQFWRSTNMGDTWTQITNGVPTNGWRSAIGVTPDDTNYVYMFTGPSHTSGTFVGMYRSTNSGVSFTTRSTTPNILGYSSVGSDDDDQTTYDHAMAVNRNNESQIVTGGINCWKSTNQGQAWTNVSIWNANPTGTNYTHADIHALEQNPLNNNLYCGSDGGIFVSSNFGDTWADLSSGLAITQNYRIAVSGTNLIINGTQDNGSNKWTGGSSMLHTVGADGMDCMIDHSNNNILYNAMQGGDLQKSTNGGASYVGIQPSGSVGTWITPYIMHPTNANIIYGGYDDIYRSNNGGSSWTNQGHIGNGAMAMGTDNTNRIYASAYGTNLILMSNNGGTSYDTVTNNLPTGVISFIAVNPDQSMDVFVTYDGYTAGQKVYRSTNAGASWTNISGSLPNLPVNCIVYEDKNGSPNDALYIGTDVGIYYRDDDIGDWIPFMNGLPATLVFDLEIAGGYITAGTYGRGFWRSNLYSDCPYGYYLTQGNDPSNPIYTGFQHYEAGNEIESTRIITGGVGTDVTYKAGSIVTLFPGFHVRPGNAFNAKNGACSGTAQSPPPSGYKEVTGTFVGDRSD